MSKELNDKIKILISDVVTHTSLEAKQAAPVNSGNLKNSIHKVPNLNKGLTGEVIVNAEYGAYVEFGTGDKVRYPDELADYASKFKGRGFTGRLPVFIYNVGWRMVQFPVSNYARPYLFPAFDRNRTRFISGCNKILRKTI